MPMQRVARAAARYRPGKAPENAGERYSSDEEGEESGGMGGDERGDDEANGGAELLEERETAASDGMQGDRRLHTIPIKLQQSDASKAVDEASSSEYETDTDEEEPQQMAKPTFRPPVKASKLSSSEYETESDSEDENEEDSSVDERPAMLKPIFVPRSQRNDAAMDGAVSNGHEHDAAAVERERKVEKEAEERRKQSHALAAARIKQEMAERENQEAKPDLDDTDGVDVEGEFQAWRIRELERIKRERDAKRIKEDEREEIERRRAMPEAQRLAEDMARANASREEKRKARQGAKESGDGVDGHGEQHGFMQKYYHKGSFFQDSEILHKRDYSAMTESAVDKSSLPTMMQRRDYGKKGQSKWTHLANEDTSAMRRRDASEAGQGRWPSSNPSCYACGGPHLRRDCPSSVAERRGRGSNNVPLGIRDGNGEKKSERHYRPRSRSPSSSRYHD